MLLKIPNLPSNGYIYIDLPTIFSFKTTSEKTFFTEDSVEILDSEIEKQKSEKDDTIIIIPKGVKLVSFEKDGRFYNYAFLKNAWLIESKGQTIETL